MWYFWKLTNGRKKKKKVGCFPKSEVRSLLIYLFRLKKFFFEQSHLETWKQSDGPSNYDTISRQAWWLNESPQCTCNWSVSTKGNLLDGIRNRQKTPGSSKSESWDVKTCSAWDLIYIYTFPSLLNPPKGLDDVRIELKSPDSSKSEHFRPGWIILFEVWSLYNLSPYRPSSP